MSFLNNTDVKKNKFIIVDNRETRLAVRHLYEELSVYLKHIIKDSEAEVHLPNQDVALFINKILVNHTNKILVKCPNCKTELAYNDLMNDAIDPKIKEFYDKKLKELEIAENCLFETFDYLYNRNLFYELNDVYDECIKQGFKQSIPYKFLLEKEVYTNTYNNTYGENDINNPFTNKNVLKESKNKLPKINHPYFNSKIYKETRSVNNVKKTNKDTEYENKSLSDNSNLAHKKILENLSKLSEDFIDELGEKTNPKKENNKYMQTLIGRLAKEGVCGVKYNIPTSIKLLNQAVENNHFPACNTLGYMHLKGIPGILEVDLNKAFRLFSLGATYKDTNCMTNLGYCYDYGLGIDINHEKAFELYKEAAKMGNIKAMSNLGYSYRHGQGCEKNAKKCIEWLYKASEKGDPSGQLNLGFCFQIGFGVKEDKEAAFRLFMNAAISNNPAGCSNVAFCYENGYGVEKDLENSFHWYLKAAELNHTKSMTKVGLCYVKGDYVKQNTSEAMKWFNLAIANGDPEAKYAVEFVREEKQIEENDWYNIRKNKLNNKSNIYRSTTTSIDASSNKNIKINNEPIINETTSIKEEVNKGINNNQAFIDDDMIPELKELNPRRNFFNKSNDNDNIKTNINMLLNNKKEIGDLKEGEKKSIKSIIKKNKLIK